MSDIVTAELARLRASNAALANSNADLVEVNLALGEENAARFQRIGELFNENERLREHANNYREELAWAGGLFEGEG